MQLRPEQLDTHLKKNLASVYFISGDEPLRVLEAADAVRAAARAQGYDEREVLSVQAGFDWSSLLAEAGNLSLFAQRRVIDLRLPTGKPGKEGAVALRAYAEQPPQDTLLLITAGKLEPAARKSKWVQTLDRAGVVIFVWPLNAQEIIGWVQAPTMSLPWSTAHWPDRPRAACISSTACRPRVSRHRWCCGHWLAKSAS
jgi:DNA polymerase-3 subunit delta